MDRPTALALLSHGLLRKVFDEVVEARSTTFSKISPAEPRQDISAALKELTAAGLLNERTTPIADFNTYYVTARGLGAQRELGRVEAKLNTL